MRTYIIKSYSTFLHTVLVSGSEKTGPLMDMFCCCFRVRKDWSINGHVLLLFQGHCVTVLVSGSFWDCLFPGHCVTVSGSFCDCLFPGHCVTVSGSFCDCACFRVIV